MSTPPAEQVFKPKQGKMITLCLIFILLSAFLILFTYVGFEYQHPGKINYTQITISGIAAIATSLIALFAFSGVLRGLPRITLRHDRLILQTIMTTEWAAWKSLSPFVIQKQPMPTIIGAIIGTEISDTLHGRKFFRIQARRTFKAKDVDILAALNARLPRVVQPSVQGAGSRRPQAAPAFRGAGSVKPWVTFALIATLFLIYVSEVAFSLTPAEAWSPSAASLNVFGGLNRNAILTTHSWYRLLTAPMLHASPLHLLFNSIALLFAGLYFERLVGRLWFIAFFMVGALGGSLMSFAVNDPRIVSVGASGAIMALFAALFTCSFICRRAASARVYKWSPCAFLFLPFCRSHR